MTAPACQYPVVEPSTENPGGDCRRPAERGIALGDTGRNLRLCSSHALRYGTRTVPLGDLDDG